MARLYYGWVVVVGCFLCCFSYGTFYTLGVFFTTLEAEFGWSATLVSSIQSVHLVVFIFSTLFVGWLTDRIGPRLPILMSAIAIGVGFGFLSRANSLSEFYFFYIIASLGAGVIWSLPTATVQRWFPAEFGLPLGIVVAGVGLGTLVYSPLAERFISAFGWRMAYVAIGIGTAALLFISFLIVTTPEAKRFMISQPRVVQNELEAGWDMGAAIHTRTFIMLALVQFLTLLSIFIVATHLVRYAELVGIDRAAASIAWGLVGGVSVAGRLVLPSFAGRTRSWTKSITLCAAVETATLIWLLGIRSVWMLYLFVVVYGFFYGGKVPLIPGSIRYFFGARSLSQLIAIAHAFSLLGGAIGPLLAGYIVDVTGAYTLVFISGAIFWLAAGILAWFIRSPKNLPPV